MSYRRTSEYDETDYYTRSRGNGGRGREVDEVDIRERRRVVSRSPSRTRRRADYDEVDVRVRERSVSRTPAFLREDVRRNETSGAMVLRQREVEEVARAPVRRPRSPSPARFRERIITRQRDRSPSIVDEREVERTRIVDRERMVERPRSPVERVRTRIVERERSPSPVERERERIRIVERRRESPSPSPSPPPPPPPPQVIRGPTIEREVITHYTDIDHGMIKVRPPSPPPPPRPTHTHKDTEIDIYTSNHSTEVDIHRSKSRHRSRERKSPRVERVVDDELVIDRRRTEDRLRIDDLQVSRRRSHSAAPPRHSYDDEAEYITSKIDRRGKMGEAWHGATRDWTIVDVPPGTERVRMDGVGGGAAEVTWQRYNGVRRSKFIPERDDVVANVASSSSTSIEIDDRSRQRDHRDRLSVRVEDRETEVEIEKERRVAVRPRQQEMWTEITKDLVSREAIEHFGYAYEETDYFYYIMQYLRQDEVMRIVEYADSLRNRRVRHREIEWDREYYDDREVRRSHQHRSRHRRGSFDHEDYREREVIVDHRPGRTYIL